MIPSLICISSEFWFKRKRPVPERAQGITDGFCSSFVRTIPSVPELHRIGRLSGSRTHGFAIHRRWGLSPRPEDIHSKWPVDSIIEFSLIHDPVICNRFFAWKNLEQKNRLPGTGMPTRVIISHSSSFFPLVFFTRVPVILMSTCQWILDVRFAKIHVQGEQNSLKQFICFKQS